MTNAKRGSILITDAHELAGLGAVRSLGRTGFDVTLGTPYTVGECPAQHSRFAGEALRYPDPWQQQAEFRDWLTLQCASGRWLFVLPIAEAAVAAAAAVRAKNENAPLLLPSDRMLAFTLSKFAATSAALEAGIPCANTLFVTPAMSDAELMSGLAAMRFPVVLRSDNRLSEPGGYCRGTTQRAETIDAARYALEEFRSRGEKVLVQEFVEGFGVGASFLRANDRCVLEFSHRRLHEVPYTGGYSSLRVSTHDVQALEFGRRLLAHIDYNGVAMVEFRRDPATDTAYFVEINGRLWGSIALALHAGVDFPAAYLRSELGDALAAPQAPYRPGIKCRHVPAEFEHVLSALKAPQLSPREKIWKVAEFALLSADPRIRHDCFWGSDPGPGFAAASEFVVRLGRRVRRKALVRQSRPATAMYRPNGQRRSHNILFVCYGNICRSPFAEQFWNGQLRGANAALPYARSAGFIEEPDRKTPAAIARVVREAFDVDLSGHRSRRLTEADADSADAIFVMDGQNYQDIERRFPHVLDKTFFLGASSDPAQCAIADPYGMKDPRDVRAVFERIAAAARVLATQL